MNFEDEFAVALPPERVWPFLIDVPRVAPCFPGAELTAEEDGVYSGNVRVKIGPVVAEYAGTATLAETDPEARRVVIDARGRERRGTGLASASVEAVLHEREGQTVVAVRTDLRITGKLAQFGSAVIQPVSAALLAQFAAALQERLLAAEPAEPAEPAEATLEPDQPEPVAAAPEAVDLVRVTVGTAPVRRLGGVLAASVALVVLTIAVRRHRRR